MPSSRGTTLPRRTRVFSSGCEPSQPVRPFARMSARSRAAAGGSAAPSAAAAKNREPRADSVFRCTSESSTARRASASTCSFPASSSADMPAGCPTRATMSREVFSSHDARKIHSPSRTVSPAGAVGAAPAGDRPPRHRPAARARGSRARGRIDPPRGGIRQVREQAREPAALLPRDLPEPQDDAAADDGAAPVADDEEGLVPERRAGGSAAGSARTAGLRGNGPGRSRARSRGPPRPPRGS